MTSTTSLASRPATPNHLTTAPQSGAGSGAADGPGRSAGAASARGATSPVLAARTSGAGRTSGAKASGARSTAKKPAGKGTAAKGGYAKTSLPADYAFLRDPKLSLEEKLSRFIGLLMSKAENDLLAQMEKMAGAAKAGGSSGSSGTGAAAAPKKVKGFSVWGAVKVLLPQVGMATKVLGEAATKKLVQQVSGPVLAAAATALGFPMLAPVALQAGKALGGVVTDDPKAAGTAAAALGGLVASAAASLVGPGATAGSSVPGGEAKASGTGSAGGGGSKAAAGGAPSSNMADQLELQRLMERQKETFSILSNILRMNHEARMTSIQNIR